MSISISSSTTATVPRFLSDFERSQSLMPSIVEQALIHGDEKNVNAQDLLHRLDMTPKEREVAMMALHDENPDQHLLNVPSLLSNLECKRLRNFIDSKIMVKQQGDFGMDDVDHCPDFQIHMTEIKLRKILGKNTMDQLLQVPCQLMEQNQQHHSDTTMSGDGWQDGNNVGIFLRRYEPDARPWMPFHLDQNAFTVNVALNSDSEFEGGRLLALYSNQIEIIPRNEGDVTCHRGSVVHGVSCITQGCRYSMILFFH